MKKTRLKQTGTDKKGLSDDLSHEEWIAISKKYGWFNRTSGRLDDTIGLIKKYVDDAVKKQNSLWGRIKDWIWCYFKIDGGGQDNMIGYISLMNTKINPWNVKSITH